MSMNRNDLVKQMQEAATMLLKEKGYISFVDILIQALGNDNRTSEHKSEKRASPREADRNGNRGGCL